MANVTHRIMLAIQARNEAKNKLLGLGNQIDRIAGLATAGGVLYLGKQIADVTWELAQLGAQAERIDRSFRTMWGGQALDALETMRQAARGGIADSDMMLSANRAMMLGVAKTSEELAALMEVARARGEKMGLSMQQAFDNIVTGIGRASPMILDNLGIVVNAAETYEAYAASIGKSADALTKAEQIRALTQRVIRESEALTASGNAMTVGAAGEILDAAELDAQGQIERVRASWKNFREEVGRDIVEFFNPPGQQNALADWLDQQTQGIRDSRSADDLYFGFQDDLRAWLEIDAVSRDVADRVATRAIQLRADFNSGRISIDQMTAGIADLRAEVDAFSGGWIGRLDDMAALYAETTDNLNKLAQAHELTDIQVMVLTDRARDLYEQMRQNKIGQDEYMEALTSGQYAWVAEQLDGIAASANSVEEQVRLATFALYGLSAAVASAPWGEAALAAQRSVEAAKAAAIGMEIERRAAEKSAKVQAVIQRMEEERAETWGVTLQAQRDYNYLIADEAGKLAILEGELAGVVKGSAEWYRIQSDIYRLTHKGGGGGALSQSASELRSMIEGVLQPTDVTEWDMAETRLGIYTDKWDEHIRRLRSAATDADSQWKHLIPTEILAQGEDAIKLYVREQERLLNAGLWDRLGEGFDGAQAMDAIFAELHRVAEEKAGRENLIATIMADPRARGLGVTRADLAHMLGDPDAAGLDMASNVARGFSETNLAATVTAEFGKQMIAQETEWERQGGVAIRAFERGLRDNLTPTLATDIARWIAPFVSEAMTDRVAG